MKKIIIDFSKTKDYKGKTWNIEYARLEKYKGKIDIFKSATGKSYYEVKRKKLYYEKTPIILKRMGGTMHEHKWYEYRYGGKYPNKQINESMINYLSGYMKPFKVKKVIGR